MKKYIAVPAVLAASLALPAFASAHLPTTAKALIKPVKALNAAAFRPFGQTTTARVVCDGAGPYAGYTILGSSFRIGGVLFTAGHIGYACGYSFNAPHDYTKFQYPSGLGLRSIPRERPYVGEQVRMVGMPGPGRVVVTSRGTIAALHQTVRVRWSPDAVVPEFDQIVVRGWSAPGMSGGAILAPDGRLVGIIDWGAHVNSAIYTGGSPSYQLR